MKSFEYWVKKQYPVLTEKEINAIKKVTLLYSSIAINSYLSRKIGRSMFSNMGLELIIAASKDLPIYWAGQKRDPVELDSEYFAKYPSHTIECKRIDDMEVYYKYCVEQERLKDPFPLGGFRRGELSSIYATHNRKFSLYRTKDRINLVSKLITDYRNLCFEDMSIKDYEFPIVLKNKQNDISY